MTPMMSNIKHAFILALAVLVAACAGSGEKRDKDESKKPATTLERIDQEMTKAADTLRPATPQKVQDAMLPPLQADLPKGAAEAVEPRFDLVVSKAPAAQVFMALVANTPYSMLVSPEVSGNISVSLKNVTVKEALESLRDIYGYDFTIRGTRVQVQPNVASTRVFQVNYLAVKRQGKAETRVKGTSLNLGSTGPTTGLKSETKSEYDLTGGSYNYSYSSSFGDPNADALSVATEQRSDFWVDLTLNLRLLLNIKKSETESKSGATVVVNPGAGLVVVRGSVSELRTVDGYLKSLQLISERQVMIEAKIIDVELGETSQSGVNWSTFNTSGSTRFSGGVASPGAILQPAGALSVSNATVTPGLGGQLATNAGAGFVGVALQSNNFAGLLNFLEGQGSVNVLSSPRIATLNNQKAVLKVGAEDAFVIEVTPPSTSASGTVGGTTTTAPTVKFQSFFSGISLDVTPQINEDGQITLHVHPAISKVEEKNKVLNFGALGTYTYPMASSVVKEADAMVRVPNGQVVVIGGLMSQGDESTSSGLPGVVDIPFVGALFGQKAKAKSKRELVILLKPTVIQGEAQWAQDVADTQARIREYQPPPPPKESEKDSSSKSAR